MHRAWTTLRTATVLCLSVGGTAAALTVVRPAPAPDHHADHGPLRLTTGRDGLVLDSSRPGTAILGGSGLAPGDSVSGDLSLTARAAFPTDVSLSLSDLVENLGPNGGRLSTLLRLRVLEEPATGPARVSYDGLLRDLGTQPLDTYAAGETRTYRFTATLPDGAGVNAVQGTSATAAFAWNAQEATATVPPDSTPAPPTPDVPQPGAPATPETPRPGETETPATPQTPATPARPARPAQTPILRLRLILPRTQRASQRSNTVIGWAVCSRPCRLVFSGRATRTGAGAQPAARTMRLTAVPAARGSVGHRTRLVLRLTPGARRALKGNATLRVTVAVTATDAAGNVAKVRGTTRVKR
jgi:hypothetical protein